MEHKYHWTEEEMMLPPEYTTWTKVFKKEASERFPECPWDHTIELKEKTSDQKEERSTIYLHYNKSLDEWIKEQLGKGYICWSKSPQAAPFFYVKKKDSKALHPCQDYQYLDEYTKPNSYPLPLILDLMLKEHCILSLYDSQMTAKCSDVYTYIPW